MKIKIIELTFVDLGSIIPIKQNPSSLRMHGLDRGSGRRDSGLGASGRVNQGGYHRASAEHAENDLPTRQPEQCLGGLSHALLSGQIVFRSLVLTSLGVLFVVPGAWGLVLILDNRRRRDWLRGLALLAVSLPVTASFYSWAAYGDPLKVWRLAYAPWPSLG
jgi:hypothetical protein